MRYTYRSWASTPGFDERLAKYLGGPTGIAIEPDKQGYKLRTVQRGEIRGYELGERAGAGDRRENDMTESHKLDAIVGRAVEAMGYDKLGLVDFLEVYG